MCAEEEISALCSKAPAATKTQEQLNYNPKNLRCLFILSTSIISDLCRTVKYKNTSMLFVHVDTFRDQPCSSPAVVKHVFQRAVLNLRATSVLGDFTRIEAAELKVIVAK